MQHDFFEYNMNKYFCQAGKIDYFRNEIIDGFIWYVS